MQGLVRCPQARIHTCRASAVASHTARPSPPAGLGACQGRRVAALDLRRQQRQRAPAARSAIVCKAAAAQVAEESPEAVAHQKFIRGSPSKVRRVLGLIRGETYEKAIMVLTYTPYRSCEPILKCLLSAGANASHNLNLRKQRLFISECYCNEAPSLKRFSPRAKGRADRILKRRSHITIKVAEAAEEVERPAIRLQDTLYRADRTHLVEVQIGGSLPVVVMPLSKLYVGGLPLGVSEDDLHAAFGKFGKLANVWVARKPPGFAFVEYNDSRDADEAARGLDGFNNWRVEHSRSAGPRAPPRAALGGGGGSGGSYGGGYPDRGPRRSAPRRHRSPSYDRYERRRRSPSYDRHERRRRSLSRGGRSASPRRSKRSLSPVRPRCDRSSRRSETPPRRSPSPADNRFSPEKSRERSIDP